MAAQSPLLASSQPPAWRSYKIDITNMAENSTVVFLSITRSSSYIIMCFCGNISCIDLMNEDKNYSQVHHYSHWRSITVWRLYVFLPYLDPPSLILSAGQCSLVQLLLSPLWPAADQASHVLCLLTVRDKEWENLGLRNLNEHSAVRLCYGAFSDWVMRDCKHVSWFDYFTLCTFIYN
jgi:hypothetical protein